jgi:hypothetical protein
MIGDGAGEGGQFRVNGEKCRSFLTAFGAEARQIPLGMTSPSID